VVSEPHAERFIQPQPLTSKHENAQHTTHYHDDEDRPGRQFFEGVFFFHFFILLDSAKPERSRKQFSMPGILILDQLQRKWWCERSLAYGFHPPTWN
jgi:hypothetical protein